MLDSLASMWARPMYPTYNLVNGTEAGLLENRLANGSAHMLDARASIWNRPVCLTKRQAVFRESGLLQFGSRFRILFDSS